MWLQFFDLVLYCTDIGKLSIQQNPREPGTFPDGISCHICISWPQNISLKALSFPQLSKLEKATMIQIFIWCSVAQILTRCQFTRSRKNQGPSGTFGIDNVPISVQQSTKSKTKALLFSPTLKVGGKKVPSDLHFEANQCIYGNFSLCKGSWFSRVLVN